MEHSRVDLEKSRAAQDRTGQGARYGLRLCVVGLGVGVGVVVGVCVVVFVVITVYVMWRFRNEQGEGELDHDGIRIESDDTCVGVGVHVAVVRCGWIVYSFIIHITYVNHVIADSDSCFFNLS